MPKKLAGSDFVQYNLATLETISQKDTVIQTSQVMIYVIEFHDAWYRGASLQDNIP